MLVCCYMSSICPVFRQSCPSFGKKTQECFLVGETLLGLALSLDRQTTSVAWDTNNLLQSNSQDSWPSISNIWVILRLDY